MTTKNELLSLNDKQRHCFGNTENRYTNFNLNQSEKCSNLSFIQSQSNSTVSTCNNKSFGLEKLQSYERTFGERIFTIKNKECLLTAATNKTSDSTVSDNSGEKRNLQSWNKSSLIDLYSTTLKPSNSCVKIKEEDIKNWKNNISQNANFKNNSTLSLHISAYENSFEPESDSIGDKNNDDLKKKKSGLTKTLRNTKQIFTAASTFNIRNHFEFLRQQNDKEPTTEPEVMQFKASQKLANRNQTSATKNSQQKIPRENDDDKDEESSTTEDEEETDNEVPEAEVVENAFLDDLIFRLMTAKPPQQAQSPGKKSVEAAPIIQVHIHSEEIIQLCDLAIQSFASQKALIRFEKKDLPLVIVGDLHGQFRDLRSILTRCGPPHKQSYLFLGDYVDRGIQGIEVATLLLALKCKYPSKVFMLRGNHEDGNTCMSYGFYDECLERFLLEDGGGDRVWLKFLSVFNWLPLAAVIDSTILAMHGGLSPHLNSLEDIDRISRPAIVPPYGLMCDLVWSDPDDRHDGWSLSPRGISFTFSSSVVESVCKKLGIEFIVRAHQLTSEMIRSGYKYFANGRLVTIFSAPNYLNMKNDACVMKISKKLHCRFVIFRTMRKAMKTRSLAHHKQRKS